PPPVFADCVIERNDRTANSAFHGRRLRTTVAASPSPTRGDSATRSPLPTPAATPGTSNPAPVFRRGNVRVLIRCTPAPEGARGSPGCFRPVPPSPTRRSARAGEGAPPPADRRSSRPPSGPDRG